MHVSLQRLKEKKKTKKEKHIFISYSLGRLTLVKKDERAKNPWACDHVLYEFLMRRCCLICHLAGSASRCPFVCVCVRVCVNLCSGFFFFAHYLEKTNCPHLEMPGFSDCLLWATWVSQWCQETIGVQTNNPSLPLHICYTRRCIPPRLHLGETVENKFGYRLVFE